MDRAKLPYLGVWGKLGCMYCGYVNGWLHYASAIAGETERYWCAIKHADDGRYIPPAHEAASAPYGDEKATRV